MKPRVIAATCIVLLISAAVFIAHIPPHPLPAPLGAQSQDKGTGEARGIPADSSSNVRQR
jgi:hypothetical protein